MTSIKIVIGLAFAIPAAALAQTPPEMVLMPKALIETARGYLAEPDSRMTIKLDRALAACEAAGAGHPLTPDPCPAVTAALKAQQPPTKPADPAPGPRTE